MPLCCMWENPTLTSFTLKSLHRLVVYHGAAADDGVSRCRKLKLRQTHCEEIRVLCHRSVCLYTSWVLMVRQSYRRHTILEKPRCMSKPKFPVVRSSQTACGWVSAVWLQCCSWINIYRLLPPPFGACPRQASEAFQPNCCLRHPENYLFLLSKKKNSESNYPKKYLIQWWKSLHRFRHVANQENVFWCRLSGTQRQQGWVQQMCSTSASFFKIK